MNRSTIVKGIAVALIAATVAGCASAKRTALKQAAAASAGALAGGDYGKALDLYQKLYAKDRANGKVVSRYAALIEEVKSAGDAAENKGSYASAQTIYGTLVERWDGFSALAGRLSFKRPDLEGGIKDCRLALCERQFRQEVAAGNCGKALAAYQGALKDYPGDKGVRSRYAKRIAEIAEVAAKALAAKDYGQAGRIHGLLLKSLEPLAGPEAAGGHAVPSPEALEEKIRLCAAELTNLGLVEYRKGNLESAIASWDDLLTFDPGNVEIKKAVETARAQLGKLKGSGKGGARTGRSGRDAKSAR